MSNGWIIWTEFYNQVLVQYLGSLLIEQFLVVINSGCITSAESVLITQQSQGELYKVLEHNTRRKQVRCALQPCNWE